MKRQIELPPVSLEIFGELVLGADKKRCRL
jgi:hypothetical protein